MWCLGVPRDVLTCKFRFMHGWDVFVGSRNYFWVRFWKGWREEMLESERGLFYRCSRQCLRKLICRTREPRLQGQLLPSSPAFLFNYLKSKTVSLALWETPVSPAASWLSDILEGQPCLSQLQSGSGIVFKRVWLWIWDSCQGWVPCSLLLVYTDSRFGFPLSAKDLNMWLFPFLLLALLWLNPSHSSTTC